jgi:hypothetical protein
LQLPGAPAPLVNQARASFAVAIHAGGSTGAHARDAFVTGIHTGLLYAAGAAILAAISVAALLKSKVTTHQLVGEGEQWQRDCVGNKTALALARIPSSQSIGPTRFTAHQGTCAQGASPAMNPSRRLTP